MKVIPLDEIDIPGNHERQREYLDDDILEGLRTSIKEEGLFHAIILDTNDRLVAGFNRFRCVERLAIAGIPIQYDGEDVPPGCIPYTTTQKTDAYSIFKIELEENLRRAQLTPVEEASALAKLHNMKQAEAPELVPGLKEKVTYNETAKEIVELKGGSAEDEMKVAAEAQNVSDSILVESYKDEPGVKNAKSLKEAVRQAKKAAAREFQQLYGALTQGEKTEGKHTVLQGSCVDLLPEVPDGTVDVILADPPYGMGADKFGDQSLGHEYKDDEEAWTAVIEALEQQASRITKPDAAMFIFMDTAAFYPCKELWADLMADWYIWPTPLIWHKPNRGHAPQPKRGPSRRYETILYAIKGNREVRKVGSDILTFAVPDIRTHAAEKPVDLYTELLSWVAYPGDTILDPCAGVGTTIEAAEQSDCGSIVMELNPGFAAECREKAEKKEND